MSAPTQDAAGTLRQTSTMYAPPWARKEAREGAVSAADAAMAASEEFRRTLPPAPLLNERRRREKPFEGDLAVMRLRERPSLDPVVMPPVRARGSSVRVLARVVGALCLAGLAAFFMVGTMPLKGVVKAEGEAGAPSLWSRFTVSRADGRERAAPPPVAEESAQAVVLADRFAAAPEALPVRAVQSVPVQVAAVQPAAPQPEPVAEPALRLRSLDRDEIATLYRRSEELIGQGDIAGARLLLTRAAEAGDARAALALGMTYDAAHLSRLGVRGIAPDAAQASAWYAKAAEFGSPEAAHRLLEQTAQSR